MSRAATIWTNTTLAEGDEEEAPEPDDATDGYAQEPGEDLLMEEETDEEDEE